MNCKKYATGKLDVQINNKLYIFAEHYANFNLQE